MNIYEVEVNDVFFWVAAETSFDAMNCAMDRRDSYQDEEINSVNSKMIPEDEWDEIMFSDNREDSDEESKVSLRFAIEQHGELVEPKIIASEDEC